MLYPLVGLKFTMHSKIFPALWDPNFLVKMLAKIRGAVQVVVQRNVRACMPAKVPTKAWAKSPGYEVVMSSVRSTMIVGG